MKKLLMKRFFCCIIIVLACANRWRNSKRKHADNLTRVELAGLGRKIVAIAKVMTKVAPFRMIGNLYFVGTKEASSHLIDTGDGLILIDTGYEQCADMIVESMAILGFDIKDVKIILHSHGHLDHTDATAKLLTLAPQAKTYLSFYDIRYIKGFTPDYDICDGDVIKLGNTEIECLFTPGHTEGSVSFFMDVVEDGQTYRAAMFGGSGINQLKKDFMNKWEVSYLCRGLFFDSVERLLKRKVDVMIGNHSWQNQTLEKYEKMKDAGEAIKGNSFTYPSDNPKEKIDYIFACTDFDYDYETAD